VDFVITYYEIYNLNIFMLNGVSDLKYMCARRVSDLFFHTAKETVLTVFNILILKALTFTDILINIYIYE